LEDEEDDDADAGSVALAAERTKAALERFKAG
jgi:hypothetical protein